MSKGGTIAIGIIVAVLVIGGLWWWTANQNMGSSNQSPAAANNSYGNQTPTAPSQNGQAAVSASDNSDAAIGQDVANMNAEMNGLSSDSANINQGLNDQPVQQEQL